ncbi:MAG: DUF4386 domain-containing protein [Flavobacteriales bacterium]|nr:DUF4386 domain-containing protein [Flavobacteriales bacterium]
MMSREPSNELQRLAKWAGWSYLLIIITSILSLVVLGGRYTVMGDSAASVVKMFEHPGFVRANAVYEVLMFSAVIVLAVLLFQLTAHLNATIARIALMLRVAEALLGYLGVILTLGILYSAWDGSPDNGVGALPVLLYDLKDLTYKVLMVCISLGTILFLFVFHRARFLPHWLTIWGMLAFALMFVSSPMQILGLKAGVIVNGIAAVLTISFEVVIGAWLIVKGVDTGAVTDRGISRSKER